MGLEYELSERDLAVIDAMQLSPRATWTQVSAATGIPALTVGRRWEALAHQGLAWSGSTMGGAIRRGVIIELRCRPGRLEVVVEALVRRAEVITVGRCSGEYQVYAIVVAPTAPATASALGLLDDLPTGDAVTDFRTTVFTEIFGGPRWRAHALDRSASSALGRSLGERRRLVGPSTQQRALFLALSADARVPVAELARRLESTPSVVRAALARMERDGLLDFRADLNRPAAGWPMSGMLWLQVSDQQVESVGRSLGGWPEARFVASTLGAQTLVVIVGLRRASELSRLAVAISRQHQDVRIADRRYVWRLDKVHGRLLDATGRSIGVVAIDPWALDSPFATGPLL